MNARGAALAAVSICCLAAGGCGYVGEPMPPLLNIPRHVEDLRVIERGDRLVVEFTAPATTTEDVVLEEPARFELRASPPPKGVFDLNAWAAEAQRFTDVPSNAGTVRYETSAKAWVGHEVLFGVKAIGVNGRESGWSNLAVVTVIAPLDKPDKPFAAAVPQGVRFEWTSPAPSFRVFRQGPDEKEPVEIARADKPFFLDTSAEFGRKYLYSVQGTAPAGAGFAESEISDAVEIVPKDVFPPATPGGLRAIAGARSVELSWDPGSEADLGGYRVYRAEGGGALTRVAEELKTPGFGDSTAASGKTYRYAISAVDALGNESKMSEPVEIAAP